MTTSEHMPPAGAGAAPTTPIRRATIFCRDIEKSLSCYRDLLQLTIVEDKRLSGSGIARMMGLEQCVIRIMHLQSGNSPDGLVGLYGIEEGQPREMARPQTGSIALGQVVLVFFVVDVAVIHRSVMAHGWGLITPPQTYVKREASGYTAAVTYTEMIFLDPDGVAVNVVQFDPEPGTPPRVGSR